jgi:hypothetical protein
MYFIPWRNSSISLSREGEPLSEFIAKAEPVDCPSKQTTATGDMNTRREE